MSTKHPTHRPLTGAVEVHQPTPLNPAPVPLPIVPMGTAAEVTTIVLPDGRTLTGYTVPAAQPAPLAAKPPVSRAAVNIALGGIGFAAVCGGLFLLTAFITALTAFITQLVILAAVIFGGWIAVQVFGHRDRGAGTTVNIRKATFKRNHFHS
ncbi:MULTISPECIES: hypothetical protein [Streptomyces]|uniref:Integral membrane protein n=1 Tax=Streptomyces evansiae TaxID=3075535 RepID=A0ABU2R3X3_9ACTN|nr:MULTISPECIES: hypothetical protein [unclassified Streptomyces]MDT0411396.1 hypothetical protein [Streptomyces sp. DSM 41979]MYQ56065.1 hypothetical protein [Streptomyces sp. SID4926]SCE53068.1 hypothetical protein GA0115252_158322 [Streptomyces sp. DfronAA-171]